MKNFSQIEKRIYDSILKTLPIKKYYPLSEPVINKNDEKFVFLTNTTIEEMHSE